MEQRKMKRNEAENHEAHDATPVSQSQEKKPLNLKYQRDKDRQMVRGMFNFHECPGGTLSFSIKLYKEDQLETYHLTDQQICSIPLGVAKHLNKNGWYPIHRYAKLEGEGHMMKIGHKVRRFGFTSLEFIDEDDLTAVGVPLSTVERATPALVV